MPRLPRVSGRELVSALARAGFRVTHVRGSHHVLRRDDGLRTVVPVHSGQIFGPGLLARILRQARLTHEELRGLLWPATRAVEAPRTSSRREARRMNLA